MAAGGDNAGGDDVEVTFSGLDVAAAGAGASYFGPYEMLGLIGEGGVARVMRARHLHPRYAEQDLALKLLHPALSADPRVVALFRREAYLLAQLRHDNLVQTFEAGSQDGQLFIAMAYVAGADLEAMLARLRAAAAPLPRALALHIGSEVLAGLAFAHALADADGRPLGLVHRDVSPANVFLGEDGTVKLGDFGVAAIAAGRLEQAREIAGKVGYFAPEQLAGGTVDARADVFAAGAVLYELICHVGPFAADDPAVALDKNRRGAITPPRQHVPDLDPEIERLLLRALARRPGSRFASAAAMRAALLAVAPPLPGATLALAALVRRYFPSAEAARVRGTVTGAATVASVLSGPGPAPGALLVVTAAPRAAAALGDLLRSDGHQVAACTEVAELGAALAARPVAVVVDLLATSLVAALPAVLASVPEPRPPLLVLARELDTATLAAATALGAIDLILAPPTQARVIGAVRTALIAAAARALPAPTVPTAPTGRRTRVLAVGLSPAAATALGPALAAAAMDLAQVPDLAAAVAHAGRASFDAAVVAAATAATAVAVVKALRTAPGIAALPCLLVLGAPPGWMTLPARVTAVAPTTTPAAQVAALVALCADSRAGRTFVRARAAVPVQLRTGGRTLAGVTSDISRGGAMVQCALMPPLGAEVGIALLAEGRAEPIHASGRVLRVALASDAADGNTAQSLVGVSFERFSGRGETDLIALVGERIAAGGAA